MSDEEAVDPFGRTEALRLISGVDAGSVEEWHRFIHTCSPLIFHVIRRYLASSSVDDQRSVYVQVLESLYHGDLSGYDGRTRLTTWLFIYTRSRCLDHLRHQRGRRSVPGWLRRLPAVDREVYRLYYRQGASAPEICQRLTGRGKPFTMAQLAESLERLDQHLDDGVRRRTAFDLQARSIGFTSGRLLEYLHRLKIEMELTADEQRPDARLLERDGHRMLRLVREFIDLLPEIERKVIALRFYERQTAEKTAATLQIDGQRKVYTIEERALRQLKRMFKQ